MPSSCLLPWGRLAVFSFLIFDGWHLPCGNCQLLMMQACHLHHPVFFHVGLFQGEGPVSIISVKFVIVVLPVTLLFHCGSNHFWLCHDGGELVGCLCFEFVLAVHQSFQLHCGHGKPSTTREFGGIGLGLAISRSLMEMMGGYLFGLSLLP